MAESMESPVNLSFLAADMAVGSNQRRAAIEAIPGNAAMRFARIRLQRTANGRSGDNVCYPCQFPAHGEYLSAVQAIAKRKGPDEPGLL